MPHVRTEATASMTNRLSEGELMRNRTHCKVEILVALSAVEYYKQGRREDVCVRAAY